MKQLATILLLICLGIPLFAARKALVIGNAAYPTSALKNPVNDATDIAAALRNLGFAVTLKTNADQRMMEETVDSFTAGISAQDDVIFYYSGHGVQLEGTNYLIPVAASIVDASDVRYKTVPANLVLDKLAAAHITVFILDACRDNPYKSFRSSSKGLAAMATAEKSQYMIVYATESGGLAQDGAGRNSPFTQAMLKYLPTSQDEIHTMMRKINKEVWTNTSQQQDPWISGNLKDEFYIAMSAPAITPQTTINLPSQPVPAVKPTPQNISGDSIDMVYVEGGTFTMGDTAGGGYDCEKPTHSVTVSSYYIGKYEVTQQQWQDIMGSNPSNWKGSSLPVEKVSWFDSIEFCNELSRKEGLIPCYSGSEGSITCDWKATGYRLPTEAEWEYAAKGGKQSIDYPYSGGNHLNSVGWYYSNSGNTTHPVGGKQANELGIYDMSGNVLEWCWDWFEDYASYSQSNPQGSSSGSCRVLRGGSWSDFATYCRNSYRLTGKPVLGGNYCGLRLLRAAQ